MPVIADHDMRPPMMAIGDSLYQGVRSLTIKRGTMQLSVPALVAEALGIRHRLSCPDPARPILIDMEGWLRLLPDFDAVRRDLADTADYWLRRPPSPSGRAVFENVAVASATVADLYTATWRSADDYLRSLGGDLRRRLRAFDLDGLDLGRIVQALNTRFTLNPSGRAALRDLSQVDLVAARLPQRLLVNIGSNNGLWEMCFEANPHARLDLAGDMRTLAARLAALPPVVEHIYVNSLGLPSAVPNLMPVPEYIEWENRPAPGAYYERYENRFGLAYGTITGGQMARLDRHVIDVNDEVRRIFREAFAGDEARLHFVDLAALLQRFDSKHKPRTDSNVVRLRNGKTLSNVMTEASIFGGFERGGLWGLDGLHPTVPGYTLMAQHVADAIAAAEPGVQAARLDLDEAWRRDKLLTDMPGIWDFGLWLWRDVRRARARRDPEPAAPLARQRLKQVLEISARGHQ